MAQYQPDLDDLLRTVQAFLDDVAPRLEESDRYQARVAGFLLGVAQRELAGGSAADLASKEKLQSFLAGDGALADLTGRLCAAIRAGDLDARWDETVALVLADVTDNVRIVRPDHLATLSEP